MPNAYIKSLAKETKKPLSKIEKLWDKAKEITSDTFNKNESEFKDKEYAYTVGIIKNMLGIEESSMDISSFVNGKMSAHEFVEAVVSGSFNIGNVVNNDDLKKEDDDEEEENKESDEKEDENKLNEDDEEDYIDKSVNEDLLKEENKEE